MMAAADRGHLSRWAAGAKGSYNIRLTKTPDRRTTALAAFCHELASACPFISVSTESEDAGMPVITVDSRLKYHAVVENQELVQFLAALKFAQKPPRISGRLMAMVDQIDTPGGLICFITPQCPHCPTLVRQLLPIVFSTPMLSLTIVDGMMFPEMAKTYGVSSAPTLFYEDDFQWTGMVSMDELLHTIIRRDPEALSSNTFQNLLKEGKAGLLADMMVKHQKIFSGFYHVLTHEKWPVRLGAMVAFEEIVRQDDTLAGVAGDELINRFDHMSDAVKGDTLYLLGLLNDSRLLPFFIKVKSGPYDHEVREAATEAIHGQG